VYGGKIVIYSGILPITKDDAGLATVMGHEVSHALANHGAQRMRDNFNKLLVPVFLLQLQDKVNKHNKYGIKLMVLGHK
jgi:Zn-dependent protease with chaperone function